MNFTFGNMAALGGEDAKRGRILEGALQVFLAYGFQRTTMEDIARAGDISRPALYLLFRNKSDIYRALAEAFVEDMLQRAADMLSQPLPLSGKLGRTFDGALCAMAEIEKSPHGAEILDMKASLAADIVAAGRQRMGALVTAAIDDAVRERGSDLARHGLSSGRLADMLLDAIDGMKLGDRPLDEQNAAVEAYVRVVSLIVENRP